MPKQTFRVTTDKGEYDIEVDVPETPNDPRALRGSTQSEMILHSMDDAAKGFFKGVIPGAANAVLGLIPGLVHGAIGAVKGGINLAEDPVKTLTDAWEAVKGSPGRGAGILKEALDLAKKDPEAFGRQMGEVTGGAEAGILGARVAPLVPGATGQAIGTTMEAAGTHGKWPLRMMGAHQIGSGNVLGGVASIMAPEALAKGGRAIRLASTPVGAVAGEMPTRFLELQQDLRAGATDVLPRVEAMQAELTAARKTAKLPEQIKDLQRQQTQLDKLRKQATPAAGPDTAAAAEKELMDVRDAAEKTNAKMELDRKNAAAKATAEAKKVSAAEALKEGTTPETTYTETVGGTTPEGVTKKATTRFVAADEGGGATGGDPLDAEMRKAGLDPSKVVSQRAPRAGDIRTGGSRVSMSQEQRNDAMRAQAPTEPVREAPLSTEDRLNRMAKTPVAPYDPAADLSTPSAQAAQARLAAGARPVAEQFMQDEVLGKDRTTGAMPSPSPSIDVLQGTPAVRPGELPPPGLTIGETARPPLRPSLSRRSPLDAAGHSMEDQMLKAQLLEQNPYLHPDEIDRMIEAGRAERSGAYRTNAGMDSFAQAMMNLER